MTLPALEGATLFENPKAWLFTVVGNLAIDITRNERKVTDLDELKREEIGDI
jgi:DNA-directed RNA polymerase specialized sigma24 family protein